jgi:putative ABC transport system permease protein
VIGVAAVITMVTRGQRRDPAVQDQIASLGTNLLMVRPGQRMGPGRDAARRAALPRGRRRGDRGPDRRRARRGAAGRHRAPRSTARATGRPWSPAAPTPTSSTNNWTLAGAALFERPAEERAGAAVCVIGATVRRELFGNADPLGSAAREAVLLRGDRLLGARARRRWARTRTTSS